jgi:hypothetical protein
MSKFGASDSKNTLYCSFCGKSQHEVRKLIAGPTVFICDECVELCMDIIREENKSSLTKSREGIPTPKEIRKAVASLTRRSHDATPATAAHRDRSSSPQATPRATNYHHEEARILVAPRPRRWPARP